MKFSSKNLLVTGGAGFIGSNFICYLLEKYSDINIINLDLLTYAGNLKNLKTIENNKRYKFIKGDICDNKLLKNIFLEYNIDGIINFAAESHVDNSIATPEIFIKTNVNGVFNLINCAYNFWMDKPFRVKKGFELARFHQVSTDEVYGSIDKGSFTEENKYAPNSPYSASKASADMIVRSFNKTYGLNTTISISSNNFGKNQNKEKFIPKIIECLRNNRPIPVYGNGTNIRDWIYVHDHCRLIDTIFCNSKSGEVYNVGAENELTNLDLIDIIYDILRDKYKTNKKVTFIQDRYGHDYRYSLDISKIKNDFKWIPCKNFKESLLEIINT
tara:strand:+ start:2724 stop:3710 length:987 start_codon:yes stop_codon:yes gene_type:complete